jgi:L-ascorbate metabolism protein UlaG (beta-lactamase superfamily)
MIGFCWHGVASYSLNIEGLAITVDPFFGEDGSFGAWFKENPHKPSFEQYFELISPEIILITHGHFDHCCLNTLKKITKEKQVKLAASKNVLMALKRFDVVSPNTEMIALKPGSKLVLGGVEIKAFKANHWQQGVWGSFISAQYAANREWGFPPVTGGGIPLSFLVSYGGEEKIFLSGDTKLNVIPKINPQFAVVNLGSYMFHPLLGIPFEPLLTLKQIPEVIKLLQCKTIVLTHFDWEGFIKVLTAEEIEEYLEKVAPNCRTLITEPNSWVQLS